MLRIGYNSNGFVHHRLEDALSWLADLGYQAVALTPDVGCLDPTTTTMRELEAIGRRCRELGLEVVIESGARYVLDPRRKHRPNLLEADDSHQERRELLRRFLHWCEPLGSRILSFWSGALPAGQSEAGALKRLAEACAELREEAAPRGVALALEPEPGHLIDTLDRWRDFDLAHPDLVELSLDVGHLLVTGEAEPHEAVREWKARIVNLQLDDMRRGEHVHLAPGEGELDWPALYRALWDAELDVPACFELSRDSHRFAELAPGAIRFWSQLATMTEPDQDLKSVVLVEDVTPTEARVIESLLRAADIPAMLNGASLSLNDEFSVSQRAMNLAKVKIEVPEARLAEARDVLRQAREAGDQLEGDA